MQVTAHDVETAHGAIKNYILRTPTVAAPRLSEMVGARLYLKLATHADGPRAGSALPC